MTISTTLVFGIRSSVCILALPFRPLYSNISRSSVLLERFPSELFKNATHTSFLEGILVIPSYKSSGTILYLPQFLLEAFSMRIPNRTSISQDWAHQSFISCFFNIFGGGGGQENKFLLKNPSVLSALVQILVVWVFHFQDICICYT